MIALLQNISHAPYKNKQINTVKETMELSVVHPVAVIWMIVNLLDLTEILAGVVVAVEEEALEIHVVVDIMIAWVALVEVDTTIIV